ncbi:MAG: YbdK family carboxylate-amine ligase [Solirubrobacterales bacterium]
MSPTQRAIPAWADWPSAPSTPYTVGVEEEVMMLEPHSWALAHAIDSVLPTLPPELVGKVSAETHGSALELQTAVHEDVSAAHSDLRVSRDALHERLEAMQLRVATAGTHPFAIWHNIVVSGGDRYQFVYGSMRELARREPTFALHVHVGIGEPEAAIRVANRLRVHLPLLLALSGNSPFWQGRDTGLASARTPLFQAFPRVGIPRAFGDYGDYVETVDLLIRCEGVPEPTFLWWDVRPQPRFGTVEVRIMDSQSRLDETAALVALTQCLAKLESEQGFASHKAIVTGEVISENRFIAARDGVEARLIDPDIEGRVAVRDLLADLLPLCRSHAQDLGCEPELDWVTELATRSGAKRQLQRARQGSLTGLVAHLAEDFQAHHDA